MDLPAARGPLSSWLVDLLRGGSPAEVRVPPDLDGLHDEDPHLALWTCYELHYQGFDDVADECEWDLDVLRFRAALEQSFLTALHAAVPSSPLTPNGVATSLARITGMSLFGLHRRWRGSAAGHLAALEMTSSLPNRRYGQGLRRLGGTDDSCQFFDEHIEADAVHEQIAAHDLCASLATDEPALAPDILFGAGCGIFHEDLFAEHLPDTWRQGQSSFVNTMNEVA